MTTTQATKTNKMDYATKCGLGMMFILNCAFDAEKAIMVDNYSDALKVLESRGLTQLVGELSYMIRCYDLA